MNTQVGKWGDRLAVCIPDNYAAELELEEGTKLEVTRVAGGILLRPRKHVYTLEELLAEIKPENIHGEIEWGSAAGAEAW